MKSYLEYTINRERRKTYIKNGRWIVQVLLLLYFSWIYHDKIDDLLLTINNYNPYLLTVIMLLPTISFLTYFILYLVPEYFKTERYRAFWIILLSLLIVTPIITTLLIYSLEYTNSISIDPNNNIYKVFFQMFIMSLNFLLGLTSFLYIMEIMDEIKWSKKSHQAIQKIDYAQQSFQSTQTDLPFMLSTIRSIKNDLDKDDNTAAENLIDFSDVLRYKIYNVQPKSTIELSKEIHILEKILQINHKKFIDLHIEGNASRKQIFKMSLVNLLLAYLTSWQNNNNENQIVLFIESQMITVGIDIGKMTNFQIEIANKEVKNMLVNLYENNATFDYQITTEQHNIQICLPIHNTSTVSS